MEFLNHGRMKQSLSRRIFFGTFSVAIAGALVLKKWWQKPGPRQTFATFLTEDGKLVQAPIEKASGKKARATKEQLVSWIWKDRKI